MSSSGNEDPEQCPHLTPDVLDSEAFVKYKSVISWNARRLMNGQSLPKRRKVSNLTCGSCNTPLLRPFLCLYCSYSGCWEKGEMSSHLKDHDHTFCVDAKTGTVYCALCDDMIHSHAIDALHLEAVLRVEEQYTPFQVKGRQREPYRFWVPSEEEKSALENTEPVSCQGRRGLLNLGQTCFLNVVLQCFVHNPLLRNYFLADKHNHKQCKNDDCSCCEMDKLFTAVYSNDTSPYGPISLLAMTWRKYPDFAGYAQRDAHEFFMATLNQMHSSCKGSTNISCNCIIHSTFAGAYQSDVSCTRCGSVTTTIDPMLDISLELKEVKGEFPVNENTLLACLKRFTQSEKLAVKDYNCNKCGKSSHDVSKRLIISQLPPVLSFQFKRFEHKSNGKSETAAQKLHAVVRFPPSLNMLPYTSLMAGKDPKARASINPGPEIMYEYDLFAVINHEGEMNNGHYTNFARSGNEWYKFDDDKVHLTTLETCLRSSPYMCFYVKRHLEYKAHVTPTYILTQKTEAVKEKEREREKELEKEREREREKERAEKEAARLKEVEKEKEAARVKEVEDELLAIL
ncbi:cysteine proteinase [Dendrothele bispora CBS 962.96]|uniref:Ubiquitin carboxyl-terminal hydrolase n=1 Tax=Dendrothele bispora (strain CBS 962.96) TaxID=1314807 RepID=A0A4S8MVD0_DENBC|nr:cysteine proteinase [Dendrothele bispora CBS 962.96]